MSGGATKSLGAWEMLCGHILVFDDFGSTKAQCLAGEVQSMPLSLSKTMLRALDHLGSRQIPSRCLPVSIGGPHATTSTHDLVVVRTGHAVWQRHIPPLRPMGWTGWNEMGSDWTRADS